MATDSKRLLGILCCRDGRLVKSYGYNKWRPGASLASALRTLDRWQLDEIVVLDISRRGCLDESIINCLLNCPVSTPIAFGGGIRSVEDLEMLSKVGCDRFVLESLLFDRPEIVEKMVNFVGRQAIIGSLPISLLNSGTQIWRPNRTIERNNLSEIIAEWTSRFVSEVLVSSTQTEGKIGGFPSTLPSQFDNSPEKSIIWFGGIDPIQATTLLELDITSAVAVGNILQEREISMSVLRQLVNGNGNSQLIRETRN